MDGRNFILGTGGAVMLPFLGLRCKQSSSPVLRVPFFFPSDFFDNHHTTNSSHSDPLTIITFTSKRRGKLDTHKVFLRKLERCTSEALFWLVQKDTVGKVL